MMERNAMDDGEAVFDFGGASRTKTLLRAVSRWLAIAAVVLSPWLFAGSEAWAYLVLCQVAGAAVAVWLLSVAFFSGKHFRGCAAGFFLVLLIGYTALQSMPLPVPAAERLNPFAGAIHRECRDALARADSRRSAGLHPGGLQKDASLSVSAPATGRSLSLLAAYAGVFLVLANTVRRWRHVRHVVAAIVISGFILAVLGIAHKFSGSRLLLWFYEPRYGGSFFGTFSNRNHFALHMNMMLGLALGMFLASSRLREALDWPDWKSRLVWLSSSRASRVALLGFAVIVLASAVFMSMSRGGVVSLAAATGFAGILFSRRLASKKIGLAILSFAFLILAAVIWLGWRPVMERLATLGVELSDPIGDSRVKIIADAYTLFGACPVFGCGFGAFRHVFPMFQNAPVDLYRWLHAHCDWMQLLAEGGIIGGTLFLAALAAWGGEITRCFTTALSRTRLFIAGLSVGFGAVALHSFVDYGMHRPANAFLFAALAGLAVAVAHLHPDDTGCSRPPSGRGRWAAVIVPVRRFLALVAVILLAMLHFRELREMRGELAFSRFLYFKSMADRKISPEDLRTTVAGAMEEMDVVVSTGGNNADALREMTAAAFSWVSDRTLEPDVRTALARKAADTAAMCVDKAPSDYLAWLWLGRSRISMGYWDEAAICGKRAHELVGPGGNVRMVQIKERRK